MREIPFDPTNDQILESMKNVPVFDSLPDANIKSLLEVSSIRHYAPGDVVIKEGEFDNWVFFLVFGELSVTVKGSEVGRLRRLGDVFGEMGIIDGSPRSATITAMRPSLCVALDDSGLSRLGEGQRIFTQAVMYRVFAEVLAGRLRDATKRVSELETELGQTRG